MSFASILSGPTEEQPARKASPQPSAAVATPTAQATSGHESRSHEPGPVTGTFYHKAINGPAVENPANVPKGPYAPNGLARQESHIPESFPRVTQRKPLPPGVDAAQISRALTDIDATDQSDVENPGFGPELDRYQKKCQKRTVDGDHAELIRRKVCVYM